MGKLTDLYNLEKLNPKLSQEWHPKKNGSLTPRDVTPVSNRKVWWICKNKHEWLAKICNRTYGKGCPFCSGNSVCQDNCLQTKNPKLSEEWHPTKNGKLTPKDVTSGTKKKVWWRCRKEHEWKASVTNRFRGTGCPFCAGSFASKEYNLQVANPRLSKEWHSVKNTNLTPSDVTPKSGKRVWWQCNRGHEWQVDIATRSKGSGCPYCAKNLTSKDRNLKVLNPILAEQWHPTKNGDLTPEGVLPNTHKKVWWRCNEGHEWLARVFSRNRGTGCPYCYRQKRTTRQQILF